MITATEFFLAVKRRHTNARNQLSCKNKEKNVVYEIHYWPRDNILHVFFYIFSNDSFYVLKV